MKKTTEYEIPEHKPFEHNSVFSNHQDKIVADFQIKLRNQPLPLPIRLPNRFYQLPALQSELNWRFISFSSREKHNIDKISRYKVKDPVFS